MATKKEIEHKLREEARLRSDRALVDARWSNIRRFVYPDSGQIYLDMPPNTGNREEVLDNTAEDAVELAAAGLHGLLTNPATQWFHLSLLDPTLAERDAPARWLEEATRRMNNLFSYAPSKFSVATAASYLDAIAFGNWCTFVEDRWANLPLFRAVAVPEVVVEFDDDEDLSRVYRTFRRPLWALKKKFGRLNQRLEDLCRDDTNHSKSIKVMHVVEPRELYDRRILNANSMPYSSCWIDVEGAEEIKEGGYQEMPYIYGRWRNLPGEIYARGCGDKMLPDTALLQRGTRGLIQATEVISEPPMMAPDEGMVKRGLNLRRRAINYIRRDMIGRKEVPQPLLTGGRTDVTEELLASVRERIRRAALKELLQLIRDPEATATQVLELKEEQMRGMSPILASVTQSYLSPMVMRTFGCATRAGAFADMPTPPEIAGMPPQPVFVSPAARAQQIAEARGISQAFDASAGILQLDPDTADNVDLDRAFRLVFKAVGTPLSVLRSPEAIAKRREERARTREEMNQREALKDITTAGKNAAPFLKVLSDHANAQQEQAAA